MDPLDGPSAYPCFCYQSKQEQRQKDCNKFEFKSAQRASHSDWVMLESLQSEVDEGEAELNGNNKAPVGLRWSMNAVSSS